MSKPTLMVLFTSIAISLSSFSSVAALTLDKSQSSVNFVSTKNQHISEQHTFDNYSGQLDDQGKLTITIDIMSVNTLIPIRNERMQKMFFNMSEYSVATFTAQIDSALTKLQAGELKRTTITGEMTIAGNTAPVSFDVALIGLKNGSINATTVKPTIISTTAFNLDDGVSALQQVAMLQSISKAVPLSFSATFSQ
ncbi:MAG: polyisoprenoid-binding protein YceI [Glaciecola sp.]|jgi:polyisoprenoid-binding protein YceI